VCHKLIVDLVWLATDEHCSFFFHFEQLFPFHTNRISIACNHMIQCCTYTYAIEYVTVYINRGSMWCVVLYIMYAFGVSI